MSEASTRRKVPELATPREWAWQSADGLSYAFIRIQPRDGQYPTMVEVSECDFSTLLHHDADSLALTLREAAKAAREIDAKRVVWGRA